VDFNDVVVALFVGLAVVYVHNKEVLVEFF